MTLRAQIAAALGVLTIVAATAAAVFSYATIEDRLQAETDEFLDDRVAQVRAFAQAVEDGRIAPPVPETITSGGTDSDILTDITRYDAEIRFYLPDGTLAFALTDTLLPITQAEIEQALRSDAALASRIETEGAIYDTRLVAIARDDARAVLQVGRDVTGQLDALDRLQTRLALVVAALSAVACAVGYFLAGRLSGPLEQLRGATRKIADTKNFSQTVDVGGTGEIADVATDFNLMLGELDTAVTQQRRLVQDAGHELRTPLSTLRASIELARRVAARGDDESDDRDELLETAIGEVDELSRLVDELVNLAAYPFDDSPNELLDLGEVVTDAVAAFRRKQPHRVVKVDAETSEMIQGKQEHLARAIANVLANAHKFAPVDTSIEVSVRANRIVIGDRGPGIPPEDLDRIFDKFYRSLTVQTIDGSGLGLAFVDEVIKAHEGSVSARNRAGGGAEITLVVPPMA